MNEQTPRGCIANLVPNLPPTLGKIPGTPNSKQNQRLEDAGFK